MLADGMFFPTMNQIGPGTRYPAGIQLEVHGSFLYEYHEKNIQDML
jgi:hypothetical protein